MALTKVTGQVINDSTGLVVGVTTVGGGLSATDGFFSGIVTAVGNASFSGSVSVGGTITYEDVTNVDSVGIITARSDILVGSGITLSNTSGSGVNVGVGITRAGTTEDVKLLKNAPIPSGSSLEFMSGNKIVLEATDTVTVDSATNNSVDASLTIMEIT